MACNWVSAFQAMDRPCAAILPVGIAPPSADCTLKRRKPRQPTRVGFQASVAAPFLYVPVAKLWLRIAATSKLPCSASPEAMRTLPTREVSPRPSLAVAVLCWM